MPLPGNISGDPNFFPKWRNTYFMDKEGSPEHNLYFDRGAITRTIWIAHEDVQQAVLDFCGSVTIVDNSLQVVNVGAGPQAGTYRALSRTVPASYPKRPKMYVHGIPNINPRGFRTKADLTGLGPFQVQDTQARGADDTPLYQLAEMSLQYVMPTYKVRLDSEITIYNNTDNMHMLPDEGEALASGHANSRYITKQVKHASKMLTINRGILKGSDDKLILEAIAINEHVADYVYTWHQIPEAALPNLTWTIASNTVNHETFDGHPAGTLLFCGDPELKLNPNPISQEIEFDVTYHLKSLRIPDTSVDPVVIRGHNYVRRKVVTSLIPTVTYTFRPDLFTGPDGGVIFRSFDFRKLFRPDPISVPTVP